MSIEHIDNSLIPPESETVVGGGSIKDSPERYRPLAQLADYCTTIFKRPEVRSRMLVSIILFMKRSLDRYSQTDF